MTYQVRYLLKYNKDGTKLYTLVAGAYTEEEALQLLLDKQAEYYGDPDDLYIEYVE